MNYILFDDETRASLLPFTHTRPTADIRCGIFTMRERWEFLIESAVGNGKPVNSGSLTAPHLEKVFTRNGGNDNLYINGNVFGTPSLADEILKLGAETALVSGNTIVAARTNSPELGLSNAMDFFKKLKVIVTDVPFYSIKHTWDIFSLNDRALREDFELIRAKRQSAPVPEGVTITGSENVFIEAGANIYAGCIINANQGPVYIGKDAEILEGVLVRGPLAICEHGVIKMGAKIYGATTIGPGCKVGGEINNAVFFANSNKSHDGYLGNSVIGEWCNLGADTNCSNLKNNYAEVKIWDEATNRAVSTGLTFCGLIMGDHSKCGINTMFNTGTVVGVSCNIFGSGFPDKFVKSFSWGGAGPTTNYNFKHAMETATRMMARRGKAITTNELEMYKYIFDNCSYQGSKY